MSVSGRRNLPGQSSASGDQEAFCPPLASACSGPLAPRGKRPFSSCFPVLVNLPRRGGRLQRWLCGSILSAVGQGTPPNSLRDLWRTSDLKGEVVPAQDRLCPWPPAARQQAATLADQERLCPPLTSAVLVRWRPGPVGKRWLELSGARGPTFIAVQEFQALFLGASRVQRQAANERAHTPEAAYNCLLGHAPRRTAFLDTGVT